MGVVRPDAVERQAANAEKSELATRLRVLRDAVGMAQEDVATASGLILADAARMEALTGDIPAQELVDRYLDTLG